MNSIYFVKCWGSLGRLSTFTYFGFFLNFLLKLIIDFSHLRCYRLSNIYASRDSSKSPVSLISGQVYQHSRCDFLLRKSSFGIRKTFENNHSQVVVHSILAEPLNTRDGMFISMRKSDVSWEFFRFTGNSGFVILGTDEYFY